MKLTDITIKPISCRACFEDFTPKGIRVILERKPLLCDKCISQIEKELVFKDTFGIKSIFLSKYDGILKTWLMNYKEYKDILLAPCFLYVFLPVIRFYFPKGIFVPLPSSQNRIAMRGFDHLSEMLKQAHLPFVNALFAPSRATEQKEMAGSARNKEKGFCLTKDAQSLKGKHVVLFDDVLTSGATLKESLRLIESVQPKKISGLIIMDNFNHGMMAK